MLACLGNQWFGKDIDRICSYNTPKIVKFRHRELGCLSRSLKFLIALYVLVWLLWYKGKHFQVFPAHGMNQVRFHHPTKHMCNPKLKNCHSNFTRSDDLPYCEGAPSSNTSKVMQLPCAHFDGMGLPVQFRNGILLPTRVRQYDQKRGSDCQPDKSNGYQCERIWEYVDNEGNEQKETNPQPLEQVFVADIERFTMMIDHSFATTELGLGSDDYRMQGYWMDCEHEGKGKLKPVNCEKRPIICMKRKCKPWMITDEKFKKQVSQSFLATLDDDEEDEFGDDVADDDDEPDVMPSSLADGLDENLRSIEEHHLLNSDRHHLSKSHQHRSNHHHSNEHHRHAHHVIDEIRYPEVALIAEQPQEVDHDATPVVSIAHGDVLTIGHLLKMGGVSLDDNHFGRTFRWRGLVLVIAITYSNRKPWLLWDGMEHPEYVIEVTRRPAYDYQLDQPISSTSTTERAYKSYHGIYIVIEQRGEMIGFSTVHLLVILSGALSLLKMASMATDYAACNLIANHEEVKNLKYEESRDFYPDRDN